MFSILILFYILLCRGRGREGIKTLCKGVMPLKNVDVTGLAQLPELNFPQQLEMWVWCERASSNAVTASSRKHAQCTLAASV